MVLCFCAEALLENRLCFTSFLNWDLTLKGDVRKGCMNSRSYSGKINLSYFKWENPGWINRSAPERYSL